MIAGLASLSLLLCAWLGLGLGLLHVRVTTVDGIYAVAAGWGVTVTASILATYLAAPLQSVLGVGLIVGCGILAACIWRGPGRPLLKPVAVALLSILPAIVSAA